MSHEFHQCPVCRGFNTYDTKTYNCFIKKTPALGPTEVPIPEDADYQKVGTTQLPGSGCLDCDLHQSLVREWLKVPGVDAEQAEKLARETRRKPNRQERHGSGKRGNRYRTTRFKL